MLIQVATNAVRKKCALLHDSLLRLDGPIIPSLVIHITAMAAELQLMATNGTQRLKPAV
jgi:hypothetical protein